MLPDVPVSLIQPFGDEDEENNEISTPQATSAHPEAISAKGLITTVANCWHCDYTIIAAGKLNQEVELNCPRCRRKNFIDIVLQPQ